jgi:hypothetical protein
MPRKMAKLTLERQTAACYAGSRPYLGSGLLGSPENRYNSPHFRVHPGIPLITTIGWRFGSRGSPARPKSALDLGLRSKEAC